MQIVTYYADWQTGFHADVRYEGTASYPEDYNNNNNNNNGAYSSSKQYGSSGVNSGFNSGVSNQYPTSNNNYNNGNSGYNSASSSVSIKDLSGPGTPYNPNNYDNEGFNYNSNDYNNGYQNYDTFSGYSNKGRTNTAYGTH